MTNVLLKEQKFQEIKLGDQTVNAQVLYEVKKNRGTGSHTQVLDLRPFGGKYALHCVTHGTTVARPTRLPAEMEAHKSATWCDQCVGDHVPPARPQEINITRDVLRGTYLFVVENWAVTTRTVADECFDGRITHARAVLDALSPLVEGIHVNEDKELTWQSHYDAENDDKAIQKAKRTFARNFPKGS